jgi:PTS system galactitol-specific IIC component
MAAVMTIIPRMAKMLMEGVYPISERIQEIAQSRAGSFGKIAIGLDSAVSVGHPVTLSVSMLMIPVMLVLAAIIPGNQFLPFASLTGLPFAFVLVTAVCRGDMFRTLLTGLLTLSLALLIGTNLAPIVTSTAVSTGFAAAGHHQYQQRGLCRGDVAVGDYPEFPPERDWRRDSDPVHPRAGVVESPQTGAGK